MLKKMILSTAICIGFVFAAQQNCFAQEKTKDELKAEREALKSEMKSKEAEERKAKIEKLEAPKTSGVASVDQLALSSAAILVATKEINDQLPDMWKRAIGESIDGVADVTVKKPTLEELGNLALLIGVQIKAVADASTAVTNAPNDIKSAPPLQAPKATKALGFTKDALALAGPELQRSLRVVNNLIANLKAANNY